MRLRQLVIIGFLSVLFSTQPISSMAVLPSLKQESLTTSRLVGSRVGELKESDQVINGSYMTGHALELPAGLVVSVEIVSQEFDPIIIVGSPDDEVLATDFGTDSTTSAQVTIEATTDGTYWFVVSSTNPNRIGEYTFNLYEGDLPSINF